MSTLTLELDDQASRTIDDLMKTYGINNRAQLIAKSLTILKIAAFVKNTGGELVARKGTNETRIVVG